ncbi:MAG: RNA polymerase sigma-70 factor, partial [Butyricimonas faecihominis]
MDRKGIMEEKVYKRIFHKYYKPLYVFAARYVDTDHADDIVQDIFLKLWETTMSFEDEEHIKLYLYKSTYHHCLNYVNHQRFVEKELTRLLEISDTTTDFYFEEAYLENSVLMAIFQAIDKLPDKCREIFILSYLDEMNIQEIANELKISINTIKTQRLRAKDALRHSLK